MFIPTTIIFFTDAKTPAPSGAVSPTQTAQERLQASLNKASNASMEALKKDLRKAYVDLEITEGDLAAKMKEDASLHQQATNHVDERRRNSKTIAQQAQTIVTSEAHLKSSQEECRTLKAQLKENTRSVRNVNNGLGEISHIVTSACKLVGEADNDETLDKIRDKLQSAILKMEVVQRQLSEIRKA